MTENQKLREVATELDRLMLVIESAVRHADPRNHASVIALILANKEALALPTAAPVGEREAFEAWLGITTCGAAHDFGWAAWQARAALRAGDAVDAQRYRWLREQHWSNSDICCVNKPKQNVRLGGICPSGDLLDAAIDAAMRKGQL